MRASAKRRILQGLMATLISGTITVSYVGFTAAAGDHRGNPRADFRGPGDDAEENLVATTPTPASTVTVADVEDNDSGNRDDGGVRPGFGCGDKNHEHSGPPGGGPSFNPCTRGEERGAEATATAAPTETPTVTETPATTATSTATATPTATTTAVSSVTATATVTSTATATTTATSTATPTATSTPTATATVTGAAVSQSSTTGGLAALIQALLHLFSKI